MILALDGALMGVSHVLSGPDHLVGVAPLATGRRRIHPAMVGLSWGIGHGLGVGILALLGQTVLSAAEVEVASHWAERLVGIVLVGLGVLAFHRARSLTVHEHTHTHDGTTHTHLHVHAKDAQGDHSHRHAMALGIGTIHGLAGAGHLLAALPTIALTTTDAVLYVVGFLLSSVVVMAGFGSTIGALAKLGGTRGLRTVVRSIAGVTIGVGLWWSWMSWAG